MLAATFFFAVVGCRTEKSSDATTVGTGVQIGPQGSVNVLVPGAGVKVAPGVVEVNGPSGQTKVGVGGVQVNGPGGQAVKVAPQGVTVAGAGVMEDDDEAAGGAGRRGDDNVQEGWLQALMRCGRSVRCDLLGRRLRLRVREGRDVHVHV